MNKALSLDAAGISDVGRVRDHNEDSLTVGSQIRLYAIADGMGGHLSGDVASQTTLEELELQIESRTENIPAPGEQEDYYNIVVDAITACNERILQKNQDNGSSLGSGMGTTLVGVYFLQDNTQAIIFNVGDSRLYRFRTGILKQLTRDHSMYQDWHDAGGQGTAPSRNILSKAIGLIEGTVADLTYESIIEDDVFLICSDGLSNLIDTDTMQRFLSSNQRLTPHIMCQDLIVMANENGGHDNVSVVIIRVNGSLSLERGVEELTVQRMSV